jgi:[CysO sulfur-carrier protein]-S-L-cysteine hydrolase
LSIPFRLLIPRSHYYAMVVQAKAELPNECCGLLAGLMEGSQAARVLQRYPLVNNAASPTEYLANDRALFDAFRDMHERNLDLLAIYHSHPVSDPVPSKTDLARNYFENVMHLIISLKAEEPVMRGWWLEEKEYRVAEWEAMLEGEA